MELDCSIIESIGRDRNMYFSYNLLYFRTPMMDLLIQVTTANKINPGGHVIQVLNDRSDDFLYYKPSTPIGKKPLNV